MKRENTQNLRVVFPSHRILEPSALPFCLWGHYSSLCLICNSLDHSQRRSLLLCKIMKFILADKSLIVRLPGVVGCTDEMRENYALIDRSILPLLIT